ncbi:hypothetical protein LJ707_13655 [Mucilaginibacter sp. UR6-1]|uniref:hypothetical protein n=1 Tax=Mucilaginibacter sp. UR6-1 TaxID=1435643 RepID=UPI001E49A7AE|nr:hypothetical protein [Mucilaginibacter sp. UR6-1]MCC8409978.1 hypothetical protein [Mucilaginibacter sp. UR6-1]
MRTLLNNIKLTEEYLTGQLPTGDKLLFEARMLLDQNMLTNVNAQRQAVELIKQYSREQLRAEIDTVHQTLFNSKQHSTFAKRVIGLFK